MTDDITSSGRFVRAGAFSAFPASAIRKIPEGDSQFAKMLDVVKMANQEPDPVMVAKNRAVQAHTVVRQGEQIVAVIGRDGMTMTSNALAARVDWASLEQRSAGMTPEQRRDLIAEELKKFAGPGAVFQRYGETGPAPTRGALDDELNRFARASWRGRE
ncbi:hypothetical protein M2352_001178 [Azospirillum fermentarium]|uniref:hypothetical protein n=1 Tax=Azospirillum fermentarium TaxID=1233114 RepID=UPI00222650C1|nr:hypothetical protein [Azospirillum fermentarium]MCW2245587.1 hypothetical protein [Azospirillum fermentarium]